MKKTILTIAFLSGIFVHFSVWAENEKDNENIKQDTIKGYALNEVVVTSSFKETNSLKKLPGATSILSPLQIDGMQISDIVNISSIVPNFFIPDYGSKYSSPVYIRGIGNRLTGQASGLYVDNVPMLNKSTYDFDFNDIQRIELLRGPQGTLYGRNAMGGILNVYTPSPLSLQQTRIGITAGSNYGIFKANVSNHSKLSDNLGISVTGYYDGDDGYFTNEYTGKSADALKSAGGRIRLDYQISKTFKASLIGDYDYSDQGAFPYSLYNKKTGETSPVSYNDEGSYLRNMGYAALNLEYKNDRIVLASTSSYQGLKDDMCMDQDYTPVPVYNINQRQKINAFTQEFSVKSMTQKNYQWSFGTFGFYNQLNTNVDVNFEEAGVKSIIQAPLDLAHSKGAPKMTVLNTFIPAPAAFKSPSYGLALFHQSTYNNLFIEGLSVTAGIRLDYGKETLDYNTSIDMDVNVNLGNPRIPPFNTKMDTIMTGSQSTDFIQLLPKLAVKYEIDRNRYVYASVSNGYNPGGFNIQTFSELVLQAALSIPFDLREMTQYKPEYSWNYEIGFKGDIIKNKLSAEVALFYIDVNDMQLTKMATAGRMIANVGKAANKGFDITLQANVLPGLILGTNYGYTNATFKDYKKSATIDYTGKYLPYAPLQTFSLYGTYIKTFVNDSFLDQVSIHAQYNGAGKIYWNEANDAEQDFYGLLNFKVGATKGKCSINLWMKNALNQHYNTFFFEMGNQAYIQQGKPATLGADLVILF